MPYSDFGPTLQDRTVEFMKLYESKGYHVSKFQSIKESKLNNYGKWYDAVIANVIAVRMPTHMATVEEFFFVLVNKKKWFQSADSERYLDNKKWEKENFATANSKIMYWMRDFNRPMETVLVYSFPDKFYYATWYNLLKTNRDRKGNIIHCPEACIVYLPDKKLELALVHESLLSSKNPHEIIERIAEEKQSLNSFVTV